MCSGPLSVSVGDFQVACTAALIADVNDVQTPALDELVCAGDALCFGVDEPEDEQPVAASAAAKVARYTADFAEFTQRRYCTEVQNAHFFAAAGIDDRHSVHSFTGVGSSGVGL